MFGNLWFIPLGAIIIAIPILLTKRKEKSKKAEQKE
jgi:cytochrome c-type biogenesis protein CcmH/NrfF